MADQIEPEAMRDIELKSFIAVSLNVQLWLLPLFKNSYHLRYDRRV